MMVVYLKLELRDRRFVRDVMVKVVIKLTLVINVKDRELKLRWFNWVLVCIPNLKCNVDLV
jgi:hypothetical protein